MELTQIIAYIIMPIITILLVPIVRWVIMKFNSLDAEMQTKVNEQQVRQLLNDKMEYTKNSLQELKEKIDKIFDQLLNNRDC